MEVISSRNNPKIKSVRALKSRKGRQSSGLFLVEGIFHIGEAAEASQAALVSIETIFYAPDILQSKFAYKIIEEQSAQDVPCYPTTADVFNSIAEKENPQGILATVRPQQHRLEEYSPDNFPWGVALVAPQDPGNVGAVLRSIDAVGASGLILLDSNLDPYHPSLVRASMGALFWHPVIKAPFASFTIWAAEHGYHIYGTSAHAERSYLDLERFQRPLILLMGSEREGLTPEQAEYCEHLLRLPMRGRATSLNLAVATGVMLYEILERERS